MKKFLPIAFLLLLFFFSCADENPSNTVNLSLVENHNAETEKNGMEERDVFGLWRADKSDCDGVLEIHKGSDSTRFRFYFTVVRHDKAPRKEMDGEATWVSAQKASFQQNEEITWTFSFDEGECKVEKTLISGEEEEMDFNCTLTGIYYRETADLE